jgi:hypothetical protein
MSTSTEVWLPIEATNECSRGLDCPGLRAHYWRNTIAGHCLLRLLHGHAFVALVVCPFLVKVYRQPAPAEHWVLWHPGPCIYRARPKPGLCGVASSFNPSNLVVRRDSMNPKHTWLVQQSLHRCAPGADFTSISTNRCRGYGCFLPCVGSSQVSVPTGSCGTRTQSASVRYSIIRWSIE